MNVTILDDYQNAVLTLPSFAKMAGHKVTIHTDHVQGTDALVKRLQDTEALLLIRERTLITRELLERLPRLRLISQTAMVPNIDLAACIDLGITVCSRIVPGRPSYATAELTWGLVLAAWRRIPQEVAHLKAGGWQSPEAMGLTLRDRTLGIHGYGRIGAVVAEYGKSFGMRVIAWGREGSLARAKVDGVEAAASEQAIFIESDVLSLHMDLNEGTRGIVRREHLAMMKPTALIVNTSRAPLIEEGALVEALKAGRPGLAAVDVFEKEPVVGAEHPLLTLPNVIATPHLGYVERGNFDFMFDVLFEQVLSFERGEPIHVITKRN